MSLENMSIYKGMPETGCEAFAEQSPQVDKATINVLQQRVAVLGKDGFAHEVSVCHRVFSAC